MTKKMVIVELRVPRNLSNEAILSLASSEIKLADFEIDPTYQPVPISIQVEHEKDIVSPHQELVLIRGMLEEGREVVLEREPIVYKVWSDPNTSSFNEQISISPEDLTF